MISSAWHGTGLSIADGIRKAKEIGFDAYDVAEDPLLIGKDGARLIRDTAADVGLPIRSAVCIALGLVDFTPAVRRFTLDRCKAFIDQQAARRTQRAARGRRVLLRPAGALGGRDLRSRRRERP